MTPTLRLVLALTLVTAACGTKVVDLVLPDSATPQADSQAIPAQKCETLMRADGSPCKVCFSPAGMVISSDCPPSSATVDAGPDPNAAPEMCKAIPAGDSRCLICSFPDGKTTMPCLKCEAPVKTSVEGDFCRACSWTDREGRCLQCFTAGGMVTHDDCDLLRPSSTMPPTMMPPDMTPDAAVMPPQPGK